MTSQGMGSRKGKDLWKDFFPRAGKGERGQRWGRERMGLGRTDSRGVDGAA